MSARLPSRMTPAVLCQLAMLAVFLALPVLLFALQSDSTVVVDKTGIFGPVIDKVWPVVITFLTSLFVKIGVKWNKTFAGSNEAVKWIVLYFLAMAFNLGARYFHITELDPMAPLFGLGLVQTVAAAIIFKFGAHKVPVLEPVLTPVSR